MRETIRKFSTKLKHTHPRTHTKTQIDVWSAFSLKLLSTFDASRTTFLYPLNAVFHLWHKWFFQKNLEPKNESISLHLCKAVNFCRLHYPKPFFVSFARYVIPFVCNFFFFLSLLSVLFVFVWAPTKQTYSLQHSPTKAHFWIRQHFLQFEYETNQDDVDNIVQTSFTYFFLYSFVHWVVVGFRQWKSE